MDKTQAQTIVKDTFESPFDKSKFTSFVKNLLNHIEEATFSYRGNSLPDSYDQYISSMDRIGKYTDDQHKIDILIVRLKKETSIERARTMQRNFIAWYLNGSRGGEMKDAALVAFVSPNEADWRFSLVKMDYRFEEGKNGRMKVKEEFTPARRWSFLVGNNENSHTAQSRLVPIIADDEHDPTLVQLEEAFNIEKVTKEFFEKYHDLFIWTEETLDEIISKDRKIKDDFFAKGVNIIDFAKKLLGQIVFLYFLQKKGWFGVERDDDWGTGPKNFLRELFGGKHCKYTNFFNDILEPLFYQALRNDRRHDDDYYSKLNCKIPFLNGGLFDPINNYDWVHTDILLPNELFSNNHKTKEGDTGNGILDVFDRYNFTVKEDEPLEREVAVDPEMLGKVFENLLGVKDRKSKGTYYTPREIVHYMCQQSLINYLHSELNPEAIAYEKLGEKQFDMLGNKAKDGQLDITIEHRSNPEIPKEDIEILIQYGESIAENDATVGLTKSYSYKLPESIRQNAKLIDDKLANIKICDPAIGSGAFPVGMMAEIVKARNVLSSYMKDPKRSIYNFKRECIEKSLYGVDIDPGAVEIAKLRLWLSLVVDEDDIKQIKPLPNLDYKIVCGNSLLSVSKNLFNSEQFKELERLKPLLFNETNPEKKREYKEQIDKLISQITNGHKEFDFGVYFSEVFHEKKGFAIVIGNPPYVRQEEIKEYKPFLQKAGYEVYNSTSDLYTYFYELSYNVLAPNGFSCFISSNKWMRAKYGENIRNFFKNKTRILQLIDFGGHKVFETATVDTNILLFQKTVSSKEYRMYYVNIENDFTGEVNEYVRRKRQTIKQNELSSSGWTLADYKVLALKKKIEMVGKPLKNWDVRINLGIKTGFNEAFIVDSATKKRLCASDPRSVEVIKPILRGRDIGRYYYKWAGLYLIKIESGWTDRNRKKEASERFFKNQYPAIYEHLISFINHQGKGKGLLNRGDQGDYWWELRDCVYYQDFEKDKIVYTDIAQELSFTLEKGDYYLTNTAYFLRHNTCNRFLLCILNSHLLDWYYRHISSQLGAKGLRHFLIYIEQLPVPQIHLSNQQPFIAIADNILAIIKDGDYLQNSSKQAQVKTLEQKIDQLVYKLYGLTDEEINIVEGANS